MAASSFPSGESPPMTVPRLTLRQRQSSARRVSRCRLLYPEVAAHLMRVMETAHWLEWQDWANPILAEPIRLEDGHLFIPDRPGNGIAWDEDAIERYRARDLGSEPLPSSRLPAPAPDAATLN
jgi:hypothetical protein